VTALRAGWPAPERLALEGRWCRLEPLASRHAAQLFAAATGPEAERLHRYLPDAIPADRAAMEAWIEEKSVLPDPIFHAVVDRATDRVEGRQSLMDINPTHGTAEIGHILWGPRIARGRVTTEAFFLLADYAMTRLGYRRWQWRCNALNEPSRRAALRFGFTFEGVFRNHMVIKGASRDTAWYSITDAEWPRLRAGFVAWLDPANFDADGQQRAKLHF
jgi:RimJ/RimL family protein N-acetyltransferase